MVHMETDLHQRIIGQGEAVVAVSEAIRRSRSGLSDPHRPIGSFIFLGPHSGRQNRVGQSAGRVPLR